MLAVRVPCGATAGRAVPRATEPTAKAEHAAAIRMERVCGCMGLPPGGELYESPRFRVQRDPSGRT